MQEIILNAVERDKIKNFKEEGFIPGILYGGELENSAPVKFDRSDLQKILSRHGSHVKLWVMYNGDKKFGFIKDIQKHPVTHNIRHIDIQVVAQNQEAKMQIPIIFTGEDQLKQKDLHLQVHKDVVDVYGKVALMPDSVHIDVSEKEQGDAITKDDFTFSEEIRVMSDEDVYGVVGQLKIQAIEEPTEDDSDEMPVEIATETKSEEE